MNEFRRKFLITGMTPNAGGIEAYIMNLVQNIDLEKVHFDFWLILENRLHLNVN